MGTSEYVAIGLFMLGVIFSIISWLLQQKDKAQEEKITALAKKHLEDMCQRDEKITLLFLKHDTDEKALHDLALQIAKNHYERNELDRKFDRLDQTFKEGFTLLGDKLDKMNSALLTHLGEHDK